MLRSSGASCQDFALLAEEFHQQLHRQSALHLELAVDARLGLLQHFGCQIGRDDLETKTCGRCAHALDQHGQRIRLLARRSGGAPDADALLARAGGKQCRHHGVAEMVERQLVAEEEGFIGGHGFDHLGDERRRRLAAQPLDQLTQRLHAMAARHRHQPAFGEVLLLGSQHQAGALPQQPAQIVEVLWGHTRSPANRRLSLPAISGNGQHGRAQAGIGHLARHAPDHAGRFVLRHDMTAGSDNGFGSRETVGAHARQHQREHLAAPDFGRRGKQRVDRRFAEIHQRAILNRDHDRVVATRDRHVLAARSEINDAGADFFAIDRLAHRTLGNAAKMLGKHSRKRRRHMLGDQDRRALKHAVELRDQGVERLWATGR